MRRYRVSLSLNSAAPTGRVRRGHPRKGRPTANVEAARARTGVLCRGLFERWDPMFSETVDPTRATRMSAILRALKSRFRGPIKVLDLGSGPGTRTERVLRSFPESRVAAVDTDPVLLRVGEVTLRGYKKRIRWVLADLRKKGWASELPLRRFDAAVSSLALHWLEEAEIRALYRDLRTLLRPDGLLINGDFLPSGWSKSSGRTTKGHRRAKRARIDQRAFRKEWENWWDVLASEPSMRGVLRQRKVRMSGGIPPRRTSGPKTPLSLESHDQALRDSSTWPSTDGSERLIAPDAGGGRD
jgi:SAM-dependent methyltransferase